MRPAARPRSSTAACARVRVCWLAVTVRSTASRRLAWTCSCVDLRVAIARGGVSHMFGAVPIHLKPATDLAPRVLLPGDPHRALAVAQVLMEQPKMFNHHRGLWGYTGTARDGELLTIQATGMGGPSAAIVIEELIELGARTLIRIGTCGAVNGELAIGDLVRVERALARDG